MKLIFIRIALLACGLAFAETYYVSESGDDSWPGTSSDSAVWNGAIHATGIYLFAVRCNDDLLESGKLVNRREAF